LEARQIRGGAAVDQPSDVDFDPAFDPDAEDGNSPPPLPSFFAEAALKGAGPNGYELTLRFEGIAPEGAWVVRYEQAVVLASDDWRSRGQLGRR